MDSIESGVDQHHSEETERSLDSTCNQTTCDTKTSNRFCNRCRSARRRLIATGNLDASEETVEDNTSNSSPVGKLHILYKHRIWPRIKWLRGTTRFKQVLEHHALQAVENRLREPPAAYPEPIRMRDWDNLILLDACRHDTYESVYREADYRYTVASMSAEFVQKNFTDYDFQDTVVITANPFYHPLKFEEQTGRKLGDVFHDAYLTFTDGTRYGTGDWDEEANTVLPEAMVRRTLQAHKEHPDKKKLVHFMQPHHPFLDLDVTDYGWSADKIVDSDKVPSSFEWEMVERGDLSEDKAITGYRQNLDRVLPRVEELSEQLTGKTVVSADHGNLLGEAAIYGHPPNLNVEPLRKVPWDVISDRGDTDT